MTIRVQVQRSAGLGSAGPPHSFQPIQSRSPARHTGPAEHGPADKIGRAVQRRIGGQPPQGRHRLFRHHMQRQVDRRAQRARDRHGAQHDHIEPAQRRFMKGAAAERPQGRDAPSVVHQQCDPRRRRCAAVHPCGAEPADHGPRRSRSGNRRGQGLGPQRRSGPGSGAKVGIPDHLAHHAVECHRPQLTCRKRLPGPDQPVAALADHASARCFHVVHKPSMPPSRDSKKPRTAGCGKAAVRGLRMPGRGVRPGRRRPF